MATIELTRDNFEQIVTGSDTVVIDFCAPWCAPCRSVAPTYEAASERHEGVAAGETGVMKHGHIG